MEGKLFLTTPVSTDKLKLMNNGIMITYFKQNGQTCKPEEWNYHWLYFCLPTLTKKRMDQYMRKLKCINVVSSNGTYDWY